VIEGSGSKKGGGRKSFNVCCGIVTQGKKGGKLSTGGGGGGFAKSERLSAKGLESVCRRRGRRGENKRFLKHALICPSWQKLLFAGSSTCYREGEGQGRKNNEKVREKRGGGGNQVHFPTIEEKIPQTKVNKKTWNGGEKKRRLSIRAKKGFGQKKLLDRWKKKQHRGWGRSGNSNGFPQRGYVLN